MRATPRERLCLTLMVGAVLAASCYGPTSRRHCSRQGDCDLGFCSAAGTCWQECATNLDCPCGSYCESRCRICLRGDNNKAATCFPHDRGLTDDDVQGVCRGLAPVDADPVGNLSCDLPIPACTIFVPQPSEDAVRDASTASDAAADAPAPSDVTVNDDTATDDGRSDDDTAADDGRSDDAATDGGQP